MGEGREEDRDLTQKPKEPEDKICPLLTVSLAVRIHGDDVVDADLRHCIKDKCALWVDIIKDTPNPLHYGEYHGCGLTQHIPYKIKKREF